MRFLKVLYKIFLFFWELPQNIIGFFVMLATVELKGVAYRDTTVYTWWMRSGLCLGRFIFVPFPIEYPLHEEYEEYIKHEYGHSRQSKYLGWLYLIVIGLPSVIWNVCFEKYRERTGKSYYDFYTEKWANFLGGIHDY